MVWRRKKKVVARSTLLCSDLLFLSLGLYCPVDGFHQYVFGFFGLPLLILCDDDIVRWLRKDGEKGGKNSLYLAWTTCYRPTD